jgi:hypothetical protein
MNRLVITFGLVAVVLVGALAYVAFNVGRPSPVTEAEGNILGNPAGMVDRIEFVETAPAWSAGKLERVEVVGATPARVTLNDSRGQFPRMGSWTGPEVSAGMPFTELLPSWNPDCPPETGIRLDVRVRGEGGRWTPWLYMGSWGKTVGKEKRVTRDDSSGAAVHIDYLKLRRPADAYQAKITFYSFALDEKVNPAVRRLAVCYSGIVEEEVRRAGGAESPGQWARDLGVPFRAQTVEHKALKGEICSPTSVSMVMQYWGFDRPTAENALAIYDPEYDLFGNWGRAVAWAGQNGFDAYLRRFRDFDQVKGTIAAGQPIIASVRFKEGECPSFVMKKTGGHLIVIRGMTAAGDFIVNDPASKEKGNGTIYRAEDVKRAWMDKGGVGYVIGRGGSITGGR